MRRIEERTYYHLMNSFNKKLSFNDFVDRWFKCFDYILRSYRVGFRDEAIKDLFFSFRMENWGALHKDNIKEYKDKTKEDLIEDFCGECVYICDRTSYDRLFRTHWLFLNAFDEEMDKIREEVNRF